MRKIPIEFLSRYAGNLLSSRLRGGRNKKLVRPMIAGLYLTMKCNFRCTYCDDGSGNLYPDLPDHRLDTAGTLKVLDIMRECSPGLDLTGGEVTLRPDIDEIMEHVGRLGFCPTTLNTNAYLLDKHLSILHHLDYLIISLDSTDAARSDELINLGRGGQTARVVRNIKLAQEYKRARGLKFDTIVNTVILPETIDDAWGVFEFCIENDFYWSPMPYVVGKYPCPGLVDNPRWHELVDEVMRAKRLGARVYGSMRVLRTIRDFARFECYPTTHAVVYPNGDLFYPCSPLNLVAGNLLEFGDYEEAMREGERKHGPIPYCDARCHIGCYMQGSTAITNPADGVIEAWRFWRRPSKTPVRLRRPRGGDGPSMPPAFSEFRKMPSLPPEETRRLRGEGLLENDFTSMLAIRGQSAQPLVAITRK
jgi:MoaA/NifB/PqqE/SkfB family radical SAM enzyme